MHGGVELEGFDRRRRVGGLLYGRRPGIEGTTP